MEVKEKRVEKNADLRNLHRRTVGELGLIWLLEGLQKLLQDIVVK